MISGNVYVATFIFISIWIIFIKLVYDYGIVDMRLK